MSCIHALFLATLVFASTISARTLRSRKEPLAQARGLPLAQVTGQPSWEPWGSKIIIPNPKEFTHKTISAIKYEAGKQLTNDVIWAIGEGVIWKLKWDTTKWGGWIADPSWGVFGRPLAVKYDAAGITFGSSTLTAYFSTESTNGVSRLAICQFSTRNPESAGNELKVTKEWDLSKFLAPTTLGLEGITFVPDYYLQANLFQTSTGKYYNPKDYPNRVDNGVFFTTYRYLVDNGSWSAPYQYTGLIYGFVLYNDDDSTAGLIATFQPKKEGTKLKSSLYDLEFDPNTGYLWTFCGDGQSYQHRVFTISNGTFTEKATFSPPLQSQLGFVKGAGRGFTIEPEDRCDSLTNRKYAYWTDDNSGILYRTDIRCGTDARLPNLYPQPVVSPNPFNTAL